MSRIKKGSMSTLFPEDSSGDEDTCSKATAPHPSRKKDFQQQENQKGFSINKGYADRYDSWRSKEELMKMKARYGTDNLDALENGSDDESSSSEEDDWTPEQEKEFFKTLANLKKKDPKIYDPKVKFFSKGEENGTASSNEVKDNEESRAKKKKQEKPYLLKDHERIMILEKGGLASDEEDDDIKKEPKHVPISYYEELDKIKKGFSSALKEIDSDDENGLIGSSSDLLMKKKVKTEAETVQEDADYRLWLKGELERLEKGKLSKDEKKELGFLRSYWTDEKLDDGEKFLRDYILNRKYIEPEDETTSKSFEYNAIAHDSDEGGLSNDEAFETHREEFEHKYNFRFEEPDPEFIKRFPRTIQDSLRRDNEKRKKEREAAKERKIEAKERKKEEVQRLKAAKRKEIIEKMRQLQEISGNPDLPVDDFDIDGDFDPAEYDRKMQKVFDEQYYDEDAADTEKPEFPFDPEIDDDINWEEWVPTEDEDEEPDVQNEPIEDPLNDDSSQKKRKVKSGRNAAEEKQRQKRKDSSIEELIEASKGKRASGKKKSVFLEVLEKKKPKFDPKLHKSFEKYFEEYYALDFEDLVGDLPCRFKYRKVVPNDFGLSVNEILKAPDKELNKWASLKKTYQYRAEDEEKYEAQAYQKKAENENLKKKVLISLYDPLHQEDPDQTEENNEVEVEQPTVENSETKKKKRKKKKKRAATEEQTISEVVNSDQVTDVISDEVSPKKKKKKRNITENSETVEQHDSKILNDDQGTNNEASPKKKKKKDRTSESNETNSMDMDEAAVEESIHIHNQEKPVKSKKKKKHALLNESSDKINGQNRKSTTKNKFFDRNQRKQSAAGGVKRKAADVDVGIEDDRLKAYGLNPKKYKKWVKYGGASK